MPFPRLANMYKHDVIRKTGSTQCIATSPEEKKAQAKVHQKFGKLWTSGWFLRYGCGKKTNRYTRDEVTTR